MYKALIELSADRAEFVSRLFSKKRPPGLGPASTVEQLFAAFDEVETSQALYRVNVQAIEDHLVKHHGFKLSADDLQQLEGIYWHFFWEGPGLRYTMNTGVPNGFGGRGYWPRRLRRKLSSYEDRSNRPIGMGAAAAIWRARTCLRFSRPSRRRTCSSRSSATSPVRALRGVGKYVREHHEVVTAFYVERRAVLLQDGIWAEFYRNVAALPVDETSTFIRSVSSRMGYTGPCMDRRPRHGPDPIKASLREFQAGRIHRYYDLNVRWK
jgi:hypothetical protein